ncbi:hypothetical protein ACFL2H_03790 [Planctomycetota bacterium]
MAERALCFLRWKRETRANLFSTQAAYDLPAKVVRRLPSANVRDERERCRLANGVKEFRVHARKTFIGELSL